MVENNKLVFKGKGNDNKQKNFFLILFETFRLKLIYINYLYH